MDDVKNPGQAPETQATMTPPPSSAESSEHKSTPVPLPVMDPSSAIDERRVMAAISYLGVFCLIPLLFAKDSAFAQYHAKQGVILAIISVVVQFASRILWGVPFGGALISVVGFVLLVVAVLGIVQALRGEKLDLPYISEWATKIHF
jgi:uncharacterized membrane protein